MDALVAVAQEELELDPSTEEGRAVIRARLIQNLREKVQALRVSDDPEAATDYDEAEEACLKAGIPLMEICQEVTETLSSLRVAS